jgi:hypothetical protein
MIDQRSKNKVNRNRRGKADHFDLISYNTLEAWMKIVGLSGFLPVFGEFHPNMSEECLNI